MGFIHVAIWGKTTEVDHFFQMQNKLTARNVWVPLCKSKQVSESLFAASITYSQLEG